MTPGQLLAESDRLLSTVVPGTRGRWPRACAWLTRLALEQALDEYWSYALPEAVNCGVRPQLLILPRYADASTAALAAEAWYGLARATHHHAYDLSPTATELRRWHDLVRAVVTELTAANQMAELSGRPWPEPARERPATYPGKMGRQS
jgi:hypothetical protein